MTTKSNRHKMVDAICEKCGKPFQARKQRVDEGKGRFCSLRCANDVLHTKGINKKYVGKENAKVTKDARGGYYVYWHDPITLKRCNTSYAHWWWEQNNGPIPEGYRASYKDGNKENIDPGNIILISSEEFGKNISEMLMGHSVEFDSRVKMSIAHTGKSTSIWRKFAKK